MLTELNVSSFPYTGNIVKRLPNMRILARSRKSTLCVKWGKLAMRNNLLKINFILKKKKHGLITIFGGAGGFGART